MVFNNTIEKLKKKKNMKKLSTSFLLLFFILAYNAISQEYGECFTPPHGRK